KIRLRRQRHRQDRVADRAADRADQRSHRASANAHQGSPLTPWLADARRPSPPVSQLPPAHRSRALSRLAARARPAQVSPSGADAPAVEARDSILLAGTPVPEFTLRREDGTAFGRADLERRTTVLVFYPFA